MRLWTLHPKYLDKQGLGACWREALLAQAVLAGLTKGYKHHPQLCRFQAVQDPLLTIGHYLLSIAYEAHERGYWYDWGKVKKDNGCLTSDVLLPVSQAQVDFEVQHLRGKFSQRNPHLTVPDVPDLHPLFRIQQGAGLDKCTNPG